MKAELSNLKTNTAGGIHQAGLVDGQASAGVRCDAPAVSSRPGQPALGLKYGLSNSLHISILAILIMLFSTGQSAAEVYYYTMDLKREHSVHYETPFEACSSWVGQGGYLKVLNVKYNWPEDTRDGCNFSYDFYYVVAPGRPDQIRPFLTDYVVYRHGDSCKPGQVLNPTTGVCGNDSDKGGCTQCPCAEVGDPINSAVGNSIQAAVDWAGSGLSTLKFTRVYNSLDGLWRHSHSTSLRIAASQAALVRADGRESFFTVSGSTVTAAPSERGRLDKLTDGWRYSAANGERFSFDLGGRLLRWSNAAGAAHQLTYANNAVTVTDHLGHSLSFTEDSQHQPLSLDAAGLQVAYAYNANSRLSRVIRTLGGQSTERQYHYEDPRNNALLTGVTDERGVRYTTWTFDDQGRATSSEHAGGAEHTQVAYNADGSATVTNELGKTAIYRFVAVDGIKRVSAIEGEASTSCPMSNSTFTYDDRGLLKTKTDNKGFVTTYAYNDRGLEESRTEAAGTPEARTVTTTWHPTLFLPATVTEPARITTYHYDEQGRSTGQTVSER